MSTFGQVTAGFANGIVNTGNLSGFHFKFCPFGKVENGGWVHDLLTATIPFAKVLFNVTHFGVFANIEGVNTVVLAIATATAVMNTATGNNGDVAVFTNVEIIIH